MVYYVEEASIREGLRFDPASAASQIERFVRAEVARMGKRGVVLGMSGGLCSTVCAYLCVRALGSEHVHAYMLPERDSDPQHMRDAASVAQALGLSQTWLDLTPILRQIGVYDLVSEQQAGNRRAIEMGLRWLTRLSRRPSLFGAGIALLYNAHPTRWTQSIHRLLWKPMGRVHAFTSTKVRLRMVMLYHYAALNNCLVAGTTDKSEWSIGFYDRYGDGASDIALLRHLYKTQIRELARYLGVPSHIVSKPSSGDLAAGVPNEDLIGLTYEQLDVMLWGIGHGVDDAAIIAQAGVSPTALSAVRATVQAAREVEYLPTHLDG